MNTLSFVVKERAVRKMFKELNDESAAKASPKRLAKKLSDFVNDLDANSLEEMNLSSQSKSVLKELIDAADEGEQIEVAEQETNGSGKDRPKRGIKKTKLQKAEAATSTQRKGKTKKVGSDSSGMTYQEKRAMQRKQIRELVQKSGPISIADIAQKLKLAESRVQTHVRHHKNWYDVDKRNRVTAKA